MMAELATLRTVAEWGRLGGTAIIRRFRIVGEGTLAGARQQGEGGA